MVLQIKYTVFIKHVLKIKSYQQGSLGSHFTLKVETVRISKMLEHKPYFHTMPSPKSRIYTGTDKL
jgi:hypothetical protein